MLLAIGYETQSDFEKQLDDEAEKLRSSPTSRDSWHLPLDVATPDGSISILFALYKGLDFVRDLLSKLNLPMVPSETIAIIAHLMLRGSMHRFKSI